MWGNSQNKFVRFVISIFITLSLTTLIASSNDILAATLKNNSSEKYILSNLKIIKNGPNQIEIKVDLYNARASDAENLALCFSVYDQANKIIHQLTRGVAVPALRSKSTKNVKINKIKASDIKGVRVFANKSSTIKPIMSEEVYDNGITFVTEGNSFSPVIQVNSDAKVTWTFADGSVSYSTNPVKIYNSEEKRNNTLVVEPWSAITRINIGYDAEDGGSKKIEFVPDQKVSSVLNLNVAAPYLKEWCSSYNLLSSLDFSNFIKLETIECFKSKTLKVVELANTVSLKRACFEECNLLELDLSQCPKLEDLRGAINEYSTINFGSIGTNIWHICVRDNPQITDQFLFSDIRRFQNISELFIWNDNQKGSIIIPSTNKTMHISIIAEKNLYEELNLAGALQNIQKTGYVDLSENSIESVDISGCIQITTLNLKNNHLSTSESDEILSVLDSLGRSRENTPIGIPLSVNLSGDGNHQPSQAGYASALSLSKKGWNVVTNEWSFQQPQ